MFSVCGLLFFCEEQEWISFINMPQSLFLPNSNIAILCYLQFQQLRSYYWNKQISLGSNTKLQITSCGSFKREPCLDSTVTQSLGAPVGLEDISPDALSIASLTHQVTLGKSHHPHLPPFPTGQTFRRVSQEGNSKQIHKNKINFLNLHL